LAPTLIQRLTPRGELLLAVAVSLSLYVVTSLLVMLQPAPSFELTTGRALIAVAFDIAALLVIARTLRIRGGNSAAAFAGFSGESALSGLALFFAWVILYFGTALVSAILFPAFPSGRPFHLLTTAPAAIVLLLTIVNAVFEEIVVVGCLMTALSPAGAAVSVGASVLLRFACHLYQGPLASVSVIPAGLVFAAVYWRTRRIWPLVVAHALGSILAFALAGVRSV